MISIGTGAALLMEDVDLVQALAQTTASFLVGKIAYWAGRHVLDLTPVQSIWVKRKTGWVLGILGGAKAGQWVLKSTAKAPTFGQTLWVTGIGGPLGAVTREFAFKTSLKGLEVFQRYLGKKSG
jgi:hypothetical protein